MAKIFLIKTNNIHVVIKENKTALYQKQIKIT